MTSRQAELMKYVRRHLSIGWWSLLFFLILGIGLEAMHGFKVAWYLNVGMETRRLMWRLAHAHGTFLALVHIALAMTIFMSSVDARSRDSEVSAIPARRKARSRSKDQADSEVRVDRWPHWASRGLTGASVAIPGGFFLGGLVIHSGDPGLGVLVLPVGALLLLVAVYLTARGVTSMSDH